MENLTDKLLADKVEAAGLLEQICGLSESKRKEILATLRGMLMVAKEDKKGA